MILRIKITLGAFLMKDKILRDRANETDPAHAAEGAGSRFDPSFGQGRLIPAEAAADRRPVKTIDSRSSTWRARTFTRMIGTGVWRSAKKGSAYGTSWF